MAQTTPDRARPEGWGVALGIGAGAGLGLTFGLMVGQLALGIAFGAALGLVVGAAATTVRDPAVGGRRVVLASAIAITAAGVLALLFVWLA